MEQKIIFAIVAILLSVLFIKLVTTQRGSGFFSFLDDIGIFLSLFVGGLPITLLIAILFVALKNLFGLNVNLYETRTERFIVKTAVITQWIIWSQLIALLFQNL